MEIDFICDTKFIKFTATPTRNPVGFSVGDDTRTASMTRYTTNTYNNKQR